MLNEKDIEKLKKDFKVPEEYLMEMGLVRAKTKTLVGRVTTTEHDNFFENCQDECITMSDKLRPLMKDAIKSNHMNVHRIKKSTAKKIKKSETAYVSVKLEESETIAFKKLCKKHYISYNRVIRYYVQVLLKGGCP